MCTQLVLIFREMDATHTMCVQSPPFSYQICLLIYIKRHLSSFIEASPAPSNRQTRLDYRSTQLWLFHLITPSAHLLVFAQIKQIGESHIYFVPSLYPPDFTIYIHLWFVLSISLSLYTRLSNEPAPVH